MTAGNVEAGLEKAAVRVEAEYEGPYLAHAAMEPMNCVVRLSEGSARSGPAPRRRPSTSRRPHASPA